MIGITPSMLVGLSGIILDFLVAASRPHYLEW